jgi:ABC-2 type transport system permease protein
VKHFFTLLSHEIRMLLVSPATYVASTLFLGFMGLIFTKILEIYSGAPQEYSPAKIYFDLFWLPACVMVPLLTMKCLADERRAGTLETLFTTPVTTAEVVLGKYGAAYLFYVTLWGATGGFFYILKRFAGEARFIDTGPLIGGYLFIAVSGLFFVAIGVLASALTRNQTVAGVNYLSGVSWLERDFLRHLKEAVDYARVLVHRDDFTRGVVDARQLLFYLSGTVLALIFSILGVEAKLLHS